MTAPDSLRQLQSVFSKVITAPLPSLQEIPAFDPYFSTWLASQVKSGENLHAGARMGIYQQQYWLRLIAVMDSLFPSLVRFFGTQEFAMTVTLPYFYANPPMQAELYLLGNRLLSWLDIHYQEEDRFLVLALTKIDLAYQKALQAPKKASIAEISCDLKICLQPHVSLLFFSADFLTFHNQLVSQGKDDFLEKAFPPISKNKKGYYFLFYRKEQRVEWRSIPKTAYTLLSAFEKGASIEEALGSLTYVPAGLGKWFTLWGSLNLFTTATI